MRSIVLAVAAFGALASGCGEPDEGAAPDLASDALVLTDGAKTRPMTAFYSFYVSPLSETGGEEIDLVVTLIDPAYACSGTPQGLDAISFAFDPFGAGASATTPFSRSGPVLGGAGAQGGSAQLTTVDARFEGSDGGAIFVGAGGAVTGEVHFMLGPSLRLDGRFTAPHCAALDFAAVT